MTSTKHRTGALALLAGVALGLGAPGPAGSQPPRPKKRAVDLNIRGDEDHFWKVRCDGAGTREAGTDLPNKMPANGNRPRGKVRNAQQ
jgi:hypothetical protein